MKARDRVLRELDHEEPDKIPWFELSIDNLKICDHYSEGYYLQGMAKSFADTYNLCRGIIDEFTNTILAATESRSYLKNTIKQYLGLFSKIGIDLAQIPLSGYIFFPTFCMKEGFIDEYGRIFDLKKNPSDNMDIAYYKDGYFKSFEDFEKFSLLDPDNPRRKRIYDMMKKVEKEFEGNIAVIPTIWGIFESSWQAFGFTQFSKLLIGKKFAKKVIDKYGNFALELAKRLIEWGESTAIMLFDDLGFKSGLLTNPNNYKEILFPWYEKLCNYCHSKGINVLFHSCGDLEPIFGDLVKVGFDAIHPIEPTTANPKYDIFKLHERYGNDVTFIGNVSPQDLADKDPIFIKEYSKKLIRALGPGGGYIFSSGHSINPSVKLENFLAMVSTREEEGIYPQ